MLTLTLVVSSLLHAAPLKLGMIPIVPGNDVAKVVAESLDEAVAAELRRYPDVQLLTPQEILAMLSQQQLEMMLGCSNDSCFAELGGAIGVDRLVTGRLSKLGRSWLVHLKVLDLRAVRTVGSVDRRIKDGDIDDVLDALPEMVAQLVGQSPPAPAAQAPAARPAQQPAPLPSGWTDVPVSDASLRARLVLLTDGADHFVAFERRDDLDGALFAGDAASLWAQRVAGGSREGDKAFDKVFWEPRVAQRWQASFAMREGAYTLRCGDRAISLTAVPAATAAKMLGEAKLMEPRWRRQAHFLARDELGTYYFVDDAREDGKRDFRLFIGPKGGVAYHRLSDAIVDAGGQVFVSSAGRLVARADGTASWSANGRDTPLVVLPLYEQARMIYRELGAYAGQALGTACEPFLVD